MGGILFEVSHRDDHALGDLHQPIGQSRYFLFRQNAPRHTLGALLFRGKLFVIASQREKGEKILARF